MSHTLEHIDSTINQHPNPDRLTIAQKALLGVALAKMALSQQLESTTPESSIPAEITSAHTLNIDTQPLDILPLTHPHTDISPADIPAISPELAEPTPDYVVPANADEKYDAIATMLDFQDASIDFKKIVHYTVAYTNLSDSLHRESNSDSNPEHQETILRDALCLLSYFDTDSAQPLPLGLSDAFMLAHAVDSTYANHLPESDILREQTRKLLNPPIDDSFDSNGMLREAFDAAERRNTFIIDEYTSVENKQNIIPNILINLPANNEDSPRKLVEEAYTKFHVNEGILNELTNDELAELEHQLAGKLPKRP